MIPKARAWSSPARAWRALHRLRWPWRRSIKLFLLALTVLLVAYPKPHLLVRNLARWRDPQALIEPSAPGLAAWQETLGPRVAGRDGRATLATVEQFVYEKVPYAFDWETWGVADYLPTVSEVLAAGREDCDGRAVVAASLLAGLGHESRLVADGAHVWVWTPLGEVMGPRGPAAIQSTDKGVTFNWRGLRVLPEVIAIGLALFPLPRELVVALVLAFLFIHPGDRRWRWVLLPAGWLTVLALFRLAGQNPRDVSVILVGSAVAGAVVMTFVSWRRRSGPRYLEVDTSE